MQYRPNILVFITHDSGQHFGCYGAPTIRTPAIDALAADGVRLTRMFATSPICSPSRGSFFTGQYPQRNGLMGLADGCYNWAFTDPQRHLSHVLRQAHYRTHLFCHQHEAADAHTLGFDEVAQCSAPSGEPNAVQVAERVADFLRNRRNSSQPFYAQVGVLQTHTPFGRGGVEPDSERGVWIPPWAIQQPWLREFSRLSGQPVNWTDLDSLRSYIAQLQGAVHHVDKAVAILTDALRSTGLEHDTLFVFTTDHGVELPRAKWTVFDPGLAIAFILRWPAGGLTGGRICDHLLSNVDFVPTLAQLLDLSIEHTLDGISFARALREPHSTPPREAIFALFVNSQLYGVRTSRYKLVRNFQEGYEPGRPELRRPAWLFDLERDPLELHDLSTDPHYAAALDEMNERFWRHLEAVNDPILHGPVPTPYYLTAIRDYHLWKQHHSGRV